MGFWRRVHIAGCFVFDERTKILLSKGLLLFLFLYQKFKTKDIFYESKTIKFMHLLILQK